MLKDHLSFLDNVCVLVHPALSRIWARTGGKNVMNENESSEFPLTHLISNRTISVLSALVSDFKETFALEQFSCHSLIVCYFRETLLWIYKV